MDNKWLTENTMQQVQLILLLSLYIHLHMLFPLYNMFLICSFTVTRANDS
jgi:hypothetical protein